MRTEVSYAKDMFRLLNYSIPWKNKEKLAAIYILLQNRMLPHTPISCILKQPIMHLRNLKTTISFIVMPKLNPSFLAVNYYWPVFIVRRATRTTRPSNGGEPRWELIIGNLTASNRRPAVLFSRLIVLSVSNIVQNRFPRDPAPRLPDLLDRLRSRLCAWSCGPSSVQGPMVSSQH
jgi:hypothetical protein